MKVSFLQPLGTFSHEFASGEFGDEIVPIPKADFLEVVKAVADKEADFGVIPFLNSSGVTVEKAHKALYSNVSKVVVTKCAPLRVTHHIAVTDGFTRLERLISKEEVFPQISNWLSTWAEADRPDLIPAASTATALQELLTSSEAERKKTGVVCNEMAVNLYGGQLKHREIQNPGNTTLFLVVRPYNFDAVNTERVLVGVDPANSSNHQLVIDEFSKCGFPLMFSSIWGKTSSQNPLFLEFQGPVPVEKLEELLSITSTKVIGCYASDDSLATCVSEFFE